MLTQEEAAAAAAERQKNQRTCGRWSPARQAPPRVLSKDHEQHHKSVPTIPSRFEVTLIKGDRERLGFGSRSLKAETLHPELAPGPGDYGLQRSFMQDCTERVSWGARGTGGFASRSVRFGARSLPSLPRPGRGVPGPGAYNQDTALQIRKPKDFNQAKQTGIFAAHPHERATSSSSMNVPGPGHYQTAVSSIARDAAAAQSAFRSASTRTGGVPISTEDTPGPGEYHDNAQGALRSPKGGDAGNAVFKEASRRHIARAHRDLPAAGEQARDALGDLADLVSRECGGASLEAAKQQPGPGYYEQDREAIWEGSLVGASGSSSFAPGSKRHEWAGEETGRQPGPGRYDPQKVVPDRLTTAASAFVSSAERNKIPFPQAPGPAYYSPQAQRHKRSFWLNHTRQWAS